MTDLPQYEELSSGAPCVLFSLAGVVFVVSLFCPVLQFMDDPLYGWGAAYMAAWSSIAGVWHVVTRREPIFEVVPMMLGTAANLALISIALFGWKVRQRHAVPMLVLAINGLVAALVMPGVMNFTGRFFGWEAYGELEVGYWLWIGTFALVAAGWWSVVREQRRLRIPSR